MQIIIIKCIKFCYTKNAETFWQFKVFNVHCLNTCRGKIHAYLNVSGRRMEGCGCVLMFVYSVPTMHTTISHATNGWQISQTFWFMREREREREIRWYNRNKWQNYYSHTHNRSCCLGWHFDSLNFEFWILYLCKRILYCWATWVNQWCQLYSE